MFVATSPICIIEMPSLMFSLLHSKFMKAKPLLGQSFKDGPFSYLKRSKSPHSPVRPGPKFFPSLLEIKLLSSPYWHHSLNGVIAIGKPMPHWNSRMDSLLYPTLTKSQEGVYWLHIVRPKPGIPSFRRQIGPLVHPKNRDHFTAWPTSQPAEEVSGISRKTHERNGLQFTVLM